MYSARCLFILLNVFLCGCNTLRGGPPVPYKSDVVWTDAERTRTLQSLTGTDINEYPFGNPVECREKRNFYANQMISSIDADYTEYRSAFVFDRQRTDAISDGLQLAMTVAGTLTDSKGVKDNYLAGIALLTGGEAIYDRSFLFEKTAPGLAAQMDANRDKQLALLLTKLGRLDCANYTGRQVLADLLAYYQAGTVMGAIRSAQTDAESKKEAAAVHLNRTKQVELGLPPAQ